MTALAYGGVSLELPEGWDGQIRRAGGGPAGAAAFEDGAPPGVLHAASFGLPAERGDYGSGAVDVMGGSDILICLLEHEPEAVGTALFSHHGVPRIAPSMFSPQSMQRAVPGMCGSQQFFELAGRAFCLYVVVGSWHTRAPLVRTADRVIGTLQISG